VEGQATDRRFIENIIFPAKLLSIHTIWLPDWSKLTKVTLTTPNMPEAQSKIERIKRIAMQIKNIELVVEYQSEK
jgi:transcription antitermination factor NusA-like protein